MGPHVPFAPALLNLSLYITLHVYFISFWLFNLLYVTCVMVNKAVKKNQKKKALATGDIASSFLSFAGYDLLVKGEKKGK